MVHSYNGNQNVTPLISHVINFKWKLFRNSDEKSPWSTFKSITNWGHIDLNMNNLSHHNAGNKSSIFMTGHSHFSHNLVAVILRYGTANFSRLIVMEIYRARFTGKRITINQNLDVYIYSTGRNRKFRCMEAIF